MFSNKSLMTLATAKPVKVVGIQKSRALSLRQVKMYGSELPGGKQGHQFAVAEPVTQGEQQEDQG